MPAFKTYRWERDRWPEYREINIGLKDQEKYLKKLCRHFKIGVPPIDTKRGHWGFARLSVWGCRILLPKECSLGMLIHEFTHVLAWGRKKYRGHGKPFKRELKRSYTWAKRWLPKNTGTNSDLQISSDGGAMVNADAASTDEGMHEEKVTTE